MTITIEKTPRILRYNGVTLADIPDMSVEEMRALHSNQYPELLNADIELGEMVGNAQVYNFRRTVGTKQ